MNVKLVLTLCASAFLLASCQNEEGIIDEQVNYSSVQTRTNVGEDYYVENGVIHFTSLDAFFNVAEEVANLSDSEFNEWEKNNNFRSYRTIANELIAEAEEIEDEKERNNFISQNANYIKEENGNILPVINANFYRSISNANGIFYICSTKNEVTDSEVIAYDERSRSVRRSTYFSPKARTVQGIQYEEREHKSGDRKVISSAKIFIETAFDAQFERHAISLEIFIDGKAKAAFGRWKHYSTTYSHDLVRVKLKRDPIDIDENDNIIYETGQEIQKPANNSGTKDSKNWTVTYALSKPLIREPQIEDVVYLYYDATTRGTGNDKLKYKVENGVTLPAN